MKNIKPKLIVLTILILLTVATVKYGQHLINKTNRITTLVPQAKAFLEENPDYSEAEAERGLYIKIFTKEEKQGIFKRIMAAVSGKESNSKQEKTMDFYSIPVHYYNKETGQMEEIDTRFMAVADGSPSYGNGEAGWEMKKASYFLGAPQFADGWINYINSYSFIPGLKEMEIKENDLIGLRAVEAGHVEGQLLTDPENDLAGKKITYPNALGGQMDLILEAGNNTFKKLIAIRKQPANLDNDLEIRFELKVDPDTQFWLKKDELTEAEKEEIKANEARIIELGQEKRKYLQQKNYSQAAYAEKQVRLLREEIDNQLTREKWDKTTIIETEQSILLINNQKTWLGSFQVWDSAEDISERKAENIKVRLEKQDNKINLTKIINKDFFNNAVYPVWTDLTHDFNDTTEVHDNPIVDSSADTNYETYAELHTGKSSTASVRRGLIKFNDIDGGLGANAEISDATMYWYAFGGDTATGRTHYAYRVLKNWTESGATWNDWQATTLEWNTAGCACAGDNSENNCDGSGTSCTTSCRDRYSTAADSTSVANVGWYSWDLTPETQDWYDGDSSEYGVIVVGYEAYTSNLKKFRSSEAASDQPYLRVTYTTNNIPTISSVSDDGPVAAGSNVTISVDWNDADAEGIKMLICTTNAVTAGASPSCTVGEWCSDKNDYDSTDPITCAYTTEEADIGSNDYWAFVCDNYPSCSAGEAGSFTVNAPPDLTPIYRSVGPNNTTALASGGGSNSLTISGDRASFSTALPDNVGVGDALQYDSDSKIAFIHKRLSSTNYDVKTATGTTPIAAAGDTAWDIFRAYTSLSNAETGSENPGIADAVENFDTWSGGRDITNSAINEQWNFACYGDGADATSTNITWDGWTTGSDNYIKIYTPYKESEVGISQRHSGTWDTSRYYMLFTNAWLRIWDDYVTIEGLQVEATTTSLIGTHYTIYTNSIDTKINNNLIRIDNSDGTYSNNAIGLFSRSNGYVWNNIIYKFGSGSNATQGIVDMETGNYYVYNNTVIGMGGGCISGNDIIARNNIVQDCSTGFSSATGDYNLSSDATAPGANSIKNTTLSFVDKANHDFHLSRYDLSAIDACPGFAGLGGWYFNDDIDGLPRMNKWDIGADEYISGNLIIDPDESGRIYVNSSLVDFATSGLVGHWTFNGQDMDWSLSSAEARDRSGQANNGDVVNFGREAVRPGISGQALYFDGSDDYIEVSDSASLDITDAITLSAWVSGQASGADTGNTGWRNPTNNGDDYSDFINPTYAYSSDDNYAQGYTESVHDYYDFSFTIPAGAGISGIIASLEGRQTGGYGETTYVSLSYDGGAHYTSEKSHMFDDGSEETYQFGSSADAWGRSWAASEFTNASFRVKIRYGGSSGEIFYLDHVKVAVYYSAGVIIGKEESAYELQINSDYDVTGYINSQTVAGQIDADWHCLTLTYDKDLGGSEEIKLYIDGVKQDAGDYATAISANEDNLKIGEYFNGLIDEVRIYNRALSAGEVLDLYRAGARRVKY